MLALTLWPTWAWLVVHGSKDIENRTWTNTRVFELIRTQEPFFIHAGLHHTRREYEETLAVATDIDPRIQIPSFDEVVMGAVIGTARIARQWSPGEWEKSPEQRWHLRGQWGYQLTHRTPLAAPIQAKGALGFWNWELEDVSNALREPV